MQNYVDHLTPVALVTMVALLCGLALIRLRQPSIVGYILAGVVLGPTGLGLVANTDVVSTMAEMGVMMLLFLIGMELSLRGFKASAKIALATAGLQIAIFCGVFYALGAAFDLPLAMMLTFGFAASLSSTAVAIKLLQETDDLRNHVGRVTVSVLIAQDLAVIPMLLIINSFSSEAGAGYIVVLKLAISVGFLGWLAWFLSRRERIVLPYVEILEQRPDIVPLAALAICFTLATFSGALGLSTAYGAFIGGLVIGNSNARAVMHQATETIQTVLLMAFFLSIGLLIDLGFIFDNFLMVLSLLALFTVVKTIVNVFVLHALGEPWDRSFQSGVVMSQVGEFSFILAAAALAGRIIPEEGYRLLISVIALSLVISPLWLMISHRMHDLAEQKIILRTLGDVMRAVLKSK